MGAWKAACASTKASEVRVPAGEYSLGAVKLEGPCHSKIKFWLQGNFKAPADAALFKENEAWVNFLNVNGLTLTADHPGAGIFDGQGQQSWKQNNCAKTWDCTLPYNFRFDYVNNSVITGITSKDSKFFHINFLGGNHITIKNITITAPGDSPNTDGIHIGRSNDINITDTIIGTGDDCISVGDGTRNLYVEKVTCGPGHGISVGSLGKYANDEPVSGITVKSCSFKETDNGIRIKTWLNSYDMQVRGVYFEDITTDDVKFPIIVDQEYCPYNHCKVQKASTVKVSDVKIKNVRGTSATVEAVKLICSSKVPCEKIEVSDIDLQYKGTQPGQATFICKNINPITAGKIIPPACAAQPTPDPHNDEL